MGIKTLKAKKKKKKKKEKKRKVTSLLTGFVLAQQS